MEREEPRYKTWNSTLVSSPIGKISHAGELHNTPGIDPSSMRILGEYALILILSGSGYYQDARGIKERIKPGNAVLVFPDLAHAYGPESENRWSHSYAIFNGPQFDLLRNEGLLDPEQPIWRVGTTDYWRQRMEECLTEQPQSTPTQSLRSVGQFTQLLIEMLAGSAEAGLDPTTSRIDSAVDLLSKPVDGVWISPTDVARRVGLSYENFRKRFTKARGISPAKFQNQKRIDFARAAIYQGTRTLQELADELGFCDAFHFSKTFKRLTGESPSVFRKKATGAKRRT